MCRFDVACACDERIGGGVIENVLLMACLMALGSGITVALLIGFLYWMEVQND